jgi:hypothetical protein
MSNSIINYLSSPFISRVECRKINDVLYKIVYSIDNNILLKVPLEEESKESSSINNGRQI